MEFQLGNLEEYMVNDDKDFSTMYYIPDFLTESEERLLIDQVNKSPKPRWTQLANRRLQNWGGIPHPKGMIAEEIPAWLKSYTEKLGKMDLFNGKTPNHVLVNEYTPGQGIMPHLDGALFFPTISTINLGSHSVLNFYNPRSHSDPDLSTTPTKNEESTVEDRLAFSLLLQPRSLVILKDRAYEHYLHGIEETTSDTITPSVLNAKGCGVEVGNELTRATRISLTIRFVPKTTKPLLRLGR